MDHNIFFSFFSLKAQVTDFSIHTLRLEKFDNLCNKQYICCTTNSNSRIRRHIKTLNYDRFSLR